MKRQNTAHGFTLVEVAVAAAVLVVAIATAFTGFTFFHRRANLDRYQNELDIEVQTAMEWIKADMRLSSLDLMCFCPAGGGPYEAMSFPLAEDTDGDGAVDVDADDNILWSKTLVYHVWSGQPAQLRLTTFEPRDNTLTDAERQQQIDSVVQDGSGTNTHNGANTSTRIIFENLFDWEIRAQSSIYDGFASNVLRDVDTELGSIILSPGAHTFEFEVVGKNAASANHWIGIDHLVVSPCGERREAEDQLPVAAQTGATAVKQEQTGGSWGGNHHLHFPATAVGHKFSLSLNNDQWEETNFGGTGSSSENVDINYDQTLSPHDFIIKLSGYGYQWYASEQTGATNSFGAPQEWGFTDPSDSLRGDVVRVLIRGREMESGGWIQSDGAGMAVYFYGGGENTSQHLTIEQVYIAECASTNGIMTPDIDPSTLTELRQHGSTIPFTLTSSSPTWVWDSARTFSIDAEKTYVVSFRVNGTPGHGHARYWPEERDASRRGCYIIEGGTSTDVTDSSWSSKTNVIVSPNLYGIYGMWAFYPAEGTFESRVCDTKQLSPSYADLDWNATVPSGCYLGMKVRSDSNVMMTNAPAWSNVVAVTSPGAVSPGNGRYVQVQAILRPYAAIWPSQTPILKDFTLTWQGTERLVEIGGAFTKGPDYGTFEVTVDGQPLRTGINVDLEIFDDVRGMKGTQRITSSLVSEVVPRNSGR
jgi:type II secretory pathway pseudopilin PulG